MNNEASRRIICRFSISIVFITLNFPSSSSRSLVKVSTILHINLLIDQSEYSNKRGAVNHFDIFSPKLPNYQIYLCSLMNMRDLFDIFYATYVDILVFGLLTYQ